MPAPELVDINLPRVPVIDNVLEGIGIDVPDKIEVDIPTTVAGAAAAQVAGALQ